MLAPRKTRGGKLLFRKSCETAATEPLIQWTKRYRITRDKPEQIICLFSAMEDKCDCPELVLKAPLVHPEVREGDRAYDRWIILEPTAGGGIRETATPYAFQAPDAGYEREFRWMYELGSRDSERWERRFYVKARNGRLYASLTVRFSSQSGLVVEVDGIVNPFGHQTLEPDPEKLITDLEEIGRIDEQTRAK